MRIVSVANEAGSAGKTSAVVNLGAIAAEKGLEVLVMDLDAQANATTWLGVTEPEKTISDILRLEATIPDALVATVVDNLWLIPSSADMTGTVLELGRVMGPEQRLRVALEKIPSPGPDLVILDCPGVMNLVTLSALVASHKVITVAQPTLKELQGVSRLESTVRDVSNLYRPDLTINAVIPSIVPQVRQPDGKDGPATSGGGAVYAQALAMLQAEWGELCTPPVRRSVRVPEAYAQQTPLNLHAPRDPVTTDYRNIYDFLQKLEVMP